MEYLQQFQWLLGLIIGFFLNQFAVSIDRCRRKKDTKNIFKKHILFIKSPLDYMSREVEKLPTTTFYQENNKGLFIKSIEDHREYLLNISKNDIPDDLINEITELTQDLKFFINTMKHTKIGKPFFEDDEFGERLTFAKSIAKRQRENVEKIFKELDI